MAASLIPDGAMLNIAHPYYGYFWLQHIAPGGLYGVAIAGTALILITQGMREERRVWIVSEVVVGAFLRFIFLWQHFRYFFLLPFWLGLRASAGNGLFSPFVWQPASPS